MQHFLEQRTLTVSTIQRSAQPKLSKKRSSLHQLLTASSRSGTSSESFPSEPSSTCPFTGPVFGFAAGGGALLAGGVGAGLVKVNGDGLGAAWGTWFILSRAAGGVLGGSAGGGLAGSAGGALKAGAGGGVGLGLAKKPVFKPGKEGPCESYTRRRQHGQGLRRKGLDDARCAEHCRTLDH
jgi:hypothetical protein